MDSANNEKEADDLRPAAEWSITAIKTTGEMRYFKSSEAAMEWLDEEGVVEW